MIDTKQWGALAHLCCIRFMFPGELESGSSSDEFEEEVENDSEAGSDAAPNEQDLSGTETPVTTGYVQPLR